MPAHGALFRFCVIIRTLPEDREGSGTYAPGSGCNARRVVSMQCVHSALPVVHIKLLAEATRDTLDRKELACSLNSRHRCNHCTACRPFRY